MDVDIFFHTVSARGKSASGWVDPGRIYFQLLKNWRALEQVPEGSLRVEVVLLFTTSSLTC